MGQPTLRVFLEWGTPMSSGAEMDALNFALRLLSLLLLACFVDAAAMQWRRVNILEGLLPICGYCKSIRTSTNEWQPMERYITEHSEARFSHGICPTCVAAHFGEFAVPDDYSAQP